MSKANILITGGSGFIGSNFIPYILETYSGYHVVNIDKLTYAGNNENLIEVKNNPNYTFIEGDICNKTLLKELFQKHRFQRVVHFAAESHVDNSIHGPEIFVQTNILVFKYIFLILFIF